MKKLIAFGLVWVCLVGGFIWGSINPAEGQTTWIMELPSHALANDPGRGYDREHGGPASPAE